jgi:hypothetical protein
MNTQSQQLTHYPNRKGELKPIDKMSKGYLKNQIEYITRTGINIKYLSSLQAELKIKSVIKFKTIM